MLMQSEDGIGVGGDIGGCPVKDQAKDGCLNPSLSSTKSRCQNLNRKRKKKQNRKTR